MDSWLLCVSFIMACRCGPRQHAPVARAWGRQQPRRPDGGCSPPLRAQARLSRGASLCCQAGSGRRARTQACVGDLGPALLREQDVACAARAGQPLARAEMEAGGAAAGAPDLMSRCRICCWCRYASPRTMSSATACPLHTQMTSAARLAARPPARLLHAERRRPCGRARRGAPGLHCQATGRACCASAAAPAGRGRPARSTGPRPSAPGPCTARWPPGRRPGRAPPRGACTRGRRHGPPPASSPDPPALSKPPRASARGCARLQEALQLGRCWRSTAGWPGLCRLRSGLPRVSAGTGTPRVCQDADLVDKGLEHAGVHGAGLEHLRPAAGSAPGRCAARGLSHCRRHLDGHRQRAVQAGLVHLRGCGVRAWESSSVRGGLECRCPSACAEHRRMRYHAVRRRPSCARLFSAARVVKPPSGAGVAQGAGRRTVPKAPLPSLTSWPSGLRATTMRSGVISQAVPRGELRRDDAVPLLPLQGTGA